MCGRYSISTDSEAIGKFFDVEPVVGLSLPNFNACPTSFLPIITQQAPLSLSKGKWGFSADWGGQKRPSTLVINARQESVLEKKMFALLTNANRCLIPADGYFEWQRNGKTKQPFRFTLKTDQLFSFAGLFRPGKRNEVDEAPCFVILTTLANSLVGDVHHRMPVMLTKEKQNEWLSLPWNDLHEIFEPFPANQMKSYKVTPKVNLVGFNSKDAIIQWQDPNLTLF